MLRTIEFVSDEAAFAPGVTARWYDRLFGSRYTGALEAVEHRREPTLSFISTSARIQPPCTVSILAKTSTSMI